MKKTKNKTEKSQTVYRVGEWAPGVSSMVKISPNRIFEGSPVGRTRKNVLMYVDEERIDVSNSLEMGLAKILGTSGFQVCLAVDPLPEYSEKADIVIDCLENPGERFLNDLEEYKDSNKLFLDVNQILEELGGSANNYSLTEYVQGMQKQRRSYLLEEAIA